MWSALACVNERTIVIRFARHASWGNVPPIVRPGISLATSPVTLRKSDGAHILGSNVSIWLGPPVRKRSTIEVSFIPRPACVACARAARSCGSVRPPRASVPTCRNSRRVVPSQKRCFSPVMSRNMV